MTVAKSELIAVAEERLEDAKALASSSRFDGAAYICGYAVELFLKYRICKQLKWNDFPSSSKEWQDLRSLKTHNLEVLLKFSGIEKKIRRELFDEWSILLQWSPENRYRQGGTVTGAALREMVAAAESIMKFK